MSGGIAISTSKGISGLGVGVLGIGAVLIWSGIQNQDLLTTFRTLAMGQKPIAGPQVRSAFKPPRQGTGAGVQNPDTSGGSGGGSGGNQKIVQIAATFKGRPYVFGGGHRSVCPPGGLDCSGYVSCVLNKAGVMKGTLNTNGFKSWGQSVKFEDRKPGDIVVWVGGAGGGHMGIIIDDKTMWHSPCTGCGGVQTARYGATRTGRQTIVRRARG